MGKATFLITNREVADGGRGLQCGGAVGFAAAPERPRWGVRKGGRPPSPLSEDYDGGADGGELPHEAGVGVGLALAAA